MEAAESALRSGADVNPMTILISADGGIRMIAGSDWQLDSLAAHHGADMAFRIAPSRAGVRVEGRAKGRSCVLETVRPATVARLLLGPNQGHDTAVAVALRCARGTTSRRWLPV